MKLLLRVVAFTVCLVASYSASSFALAAGPSQLATAPIPTCSPRKCTVLSAGAGPSQPTTAPIPTCSPKKCTVLSAQ